MKGNAVGHGKTLGAYVLAALPLLALTLAPALGLAADEQLIDGGKEPSFYSWDEFLNMLMRVTNFLIKLAVMFAAGLFMWAGWKYATAGGNPTKVQEAHRIFRNVAVGIVVAVGAFLIVATIIKAVGADENADIKEWITV